MHLKKLAPDFNFSTPHADYENISLDRVLELAARDIGLSVNLQHCRQLKHNPNIELAAKEGLILRKRVRVYGWGNKAGKKRTQYHITQKGLAKLQKKT